MTIHLYDLRAPAAPKQSDLAGLEKQLSSLVGQPFRFVQVSYGDELTLHFGDVQPAKNPLLKGMPFGETILGVCGSHWVFKSGTEPIVICAGDHGAQPELGPTLTNAELEEKSVVVPGSRVVSATPFVVLPIRGFGLDLRLSDGSSLLVLPTPPDPNPPGEEPLAPLADWELLTPRGLISAWPNLKWTYEVETDMQAPTNLPKEIEWQPLIDAFKNATENGEDPSLAYQKILDAVSGIQEGVKVPSEVEKLLADDARRKMIDSLKPRIRKIRPLPSEEA